MTRIGRRPRTGLAALAVGAVALGAGAVAITATNGGPADASAELAAQIDPAQPRNVILIIGDGTDDAIITAARNYEHGAGGRFPALDALPFTGAMTTYSLLPGPGPDYGSQYVADSAATATALATGHKTINGRLSQGPSGAATTPGQDLPTALQILRDRGKRTGNVSTAVVWDATPASQGAQINFRTCGGPMVMADCPDARKANGGKGSVAEQLVDNQIDVLLGGGRAAFLQSTDAGPTVLAHAENQHNYREVQTAAELDAITSLDNGPILGLFADGHLTPRYQPLVAAVPPGAGGPDQRCALADRGTQPSLGAMTAKAIELLDNPEGFFLQVESALIDKQEHAMDACGAIGDVVELDDAVGVAMDYQRANPDTLVIVTGDHAHSTQIVSHPAAGRQTVTLKTAEGDPMYLAYSTGIGGADHTGTQIRVAAVGPQAANVNGVIDQTDVFNLLVGLPPSTPAPGPSVTTTVTSTVTAPPPPATTVTGPTVTTTRTVPAPPVRPRASHAFSARISRTALRRNGLPVAVAAQGATRLRLQLRVGTRVVLNRAMPVAGGRTTLRTPRLQAPGQAVVRVVATGPGGVTTVNRPLRITR